MKLKEYLTAGAVILFIFVIYISFSKGRELEQMKCNAKITTIENERQEQVIINQKATNEVKTKQQKIISLPVPTDDYVDKWMQWLTEENAYSLE